MSVVGVDLAFPPLRMEAVARTREKCQRLVRLEQRLQRQRKLIANMKTGGKDTSANNGSSEDCYGNWMACSTNPSRFIPAASWPPALPKRAHLCPKKNRHS